MPDKLKKQERPSIRVAQLRFRLGHAGGLRHRCQQLKCASGVPATALGPPTTESHDRQYPGSYPPSLADPAVRSEAFLFLGKDRSVRNDAGSSGVAASDFAFTGTSGLDHNQADCLHR